jgi:hypothetical protein
MTVVESAGINIRVHGDLKLETVGTNVRVEQMSPSCKRICRLTFDDGTILQGCWTASDNWQFRLLRKGDKVAMLEAGDRGYASSVVFKDGLNWGFISTTFYHFDQGE